MNLDDVTKNIDETWQRRILDDLIARVSPFERLLPKRRRPTRFERLRWKGEVAADRLRRAWLVLTGMED